MSILGPNGINYKIATSTQKFSLLDSAQTKKGKFVYVQANGAVAQYQFVGIDPTTGKAIILQSTTSAGKPMLVGVAQCAFTDTYYGWVWVGCGGGTGVGIKGSCLASAAAGARLSTTSTAGSVDDAACGNGAAPWRIFNVVTCATDSGSGSNLELFATAEMTADYSIPLSA